MTRPVELVLWAGLVLASAGAGVAIAGLPDLDRGSDDAGAPVITTTTTSTSTTTTTEAPTTTTTEPGADPTTTTTEPEPPPEPEVRPPEEVTVLVANSTDVVGAAGRTTVSLTAEGYPTLTPATVTGFDRSEIWFAEGYGAEAARLAERLGIFPEDVGPIPGDPGFAIGGADLVVILGPGLAENA